MLLEPLSSVTLKDTFSEPYQFGGWEKVTTFLLFIDALMLWGFVR